MRFQKNPVSVILREWPSFCLRLGLLDLGGRLAGWNPRARKLLEHSAGSGSTDQRPRAVGSAPSNSGVGSAVRDSPLLHGGGRRGSQRRRGQTPGSREGAARSEGNVGPPDRTRGRGCHTRDGPGRVGSSRRQEVPRRGQVGPTGDFPRRPRPRRRNRDEREAA